ncbi:hypothetical protein BXZ70DRAFT_944078, partial [Cristinia sonorae]
AAALDTNAAALDTNAAALDTNAPAAAALNAMTTTAPNTYSSAAALDTNTAALDTNAAALDTNAPAAAALNAMTTTAPDTNSSAGAIAIVNSLNDIDRNLPTIAATDADPFNVVVTWHTSDPTPLTRRTSPTHAAAASQDKGSTDDTHDAASSSGASPAIGARKTTRKRKTSDSEEGENTGEQDTCKKARRLGPKTLCKARWMDENPNENKIAQKKAFDVYYASLTGDDLKYWKNEAQRVKVIQADGSAAAV